MEELVDLVGQGVAPPAGAWIETKREDHGDSAPLLVAPPAGAWIETICPFRISKKRFVAPPAGAWIETRKRAGSELGSPVAPPAGAWIETGGVKWISDEQASRSPRGSVD